MEPWEWDEQRWRGAVEHVRAGRSLSPSPWPGGARVAVAVSFDVDHETPWLRDGDTGPGGLSEGEYGSRAALGRILSALATASCPATFFFPAVSALLHPHDVVRVAEQGHEVGAHGWIHERPDLLPAGAESDLLARSLDALEGVAGRRPSGYRAPSFAPSAQTIDVVARAGLLYDSSLMADDEPYEPVLDGQPSGVVEIPVDWSRDDAAYFVMDRFAGVRPLPARADVLDLWQREFRRAREERGLFQLTLHPDLIGTRGRIGILEDVLAEVTASGDVWLATHEQVAQHCRAGLA